MQLVKVLKPKRVSVRGATGGIVNRPGRLSVWCWYKASCTLNAVGVPPSLGACPSPVRPSPVRRPLSWMSPCPPLPSEDFDFDCPLVSRGTVAKLLDNRHYIPALKSPLQYHYRLRAVPDFVSVGIIDANSSPWNRARHECKVFARERYSNARRAQVLAVAHDRGRLPHRISTEQLLVLDLVTSPER